MRPDRDEDPLAEIVELLDHAATQSGDYHGIEQEFARSAPDKKTATDAEREAVKALTAAFQYTLRHGLSHPDATPFVPMFEFDDRQIPPRPSEVPDSWREAWSQSAGRARHPAVVARLADLLFAIRHGRVGERAQLAITNYLALVELTSWSHLDITHGLERAYDLAIRTKNSDALSEVLRVMEGCVRNWLDEEQPPGVAIPPLERLLEHPEFKQRGLQLLSDALTAYSSNPHIVDDILLLKRRASSSEERKQVDRNRVENWLLAAETESGPNSLFFMERAARLAEDAGIIELRDKAIRGMQALDSENLGLERNQFSFDLPTEVVEDYLNQFVASQSWQEALIAATVHTPLTGDHDENLEFLKVIEREAPISSMLRRVKLGGDGLPRWHAETEEQQLDDKLSEHEVMRFRLSAPLYAEGLIRLGRHYQIDSSELIATLSDRPGFDDSAAQVVASAFHLFWDGNYNESAHIAIWQIEGTLRRLLLQADRPVYAVQRSKNPGQYVGLNALLNELARLGLVTSWHRYISTIFASPAGIGLRNEVAHGFVTKLGPAEAAAILHVVSYLSLLRATT